MIDLYRDRPDLYDLLHDAERGDVTFYVAMARALAPAHGTVLELGCGTGRVMEALLEQGLQVTGLDSEPAMLARASRRLARFGDRARLMQADMRCPELGGQQNDLVLVTANTFMHLEDHAAQRSCLCGIHAHLSSGSAAVLDLANPFHVLALPQGVVTLRRHVHDDASGRAVVVFGALEVDPTAPRMVDRLFVDETGPDGLVRRFSCQVELRLVFMPELELLLAACGLGIADAYGDYDLGPYDAAAERMIAVVRRLA
jgi:SAM-dependent methyltransferase